VGTEHLLLKQITSEDQKDAVSVSAGDLLILLGRLNICASKSVMFLEW
jgi:leucyl-tRNA synthetase